MIINTSGMSFEVWAAAVSQQLGLNGDVVVVIPEEPWQEWAGRVMRLSVIQSQRAPRPDLFDDWKEWADAFNRTVVY